MKSSTFENRISLWLCVVSLLVYVLHSEAVRMFWREAARLIGKL